METNNFSVVIPLYNKAKYIQRTLKSVLNQTYPHFEIVVIDDGSTDDGPRIVKDINDSRIRLIRQENAGVSAARNKGIEEARFELVSFLDADDWWDNDYLEQINMLAVKYPDASFFAARKATIDRDGTIVEKKLFPSAQSDGYIDLLKYSYNYADLPIHISSVTIKKSICRYSGVFDTRLSYYEDFDFMLRICAFSKLAYTEQKPLFFHDIRLEPSEKATGRLHPMNKHMIYYTEKWAPFISLLPDLKTFIDRFTLSKLILYRRDKKWREDVKRIKTTIAEENWSWKYKLIFSMPVSLTGWLVKTNLFFKPINKSLPGIENNNQTSLSSGC